MYLHSRQYNPLYVFFCMISTLNKYFRSKDSMSMSEMSRNSHPHPYVLSQMQPYYGPNHHRNSQNNQNSQYPVSQSDWDDTHFRWPSPSLPPTLKKGQNKHHFGTLDKGKYKSWGFLQHHLCKHQLFRQKFNCWL